jgi:hypothetical protein
MLADRTEHPEPSVTMPTPGASVRTRAVTRHSGGAASVGALAMGAVVLGALTVGPIAMRRTRILSDRAEHPEPSHHLAGSADIAEPLGELQEPNLGSLCVVREQDRMFNGWLTMPNLIAWRPTFRIRHRGTLSSNSGF